MKGSKLCQILHADKTGFRRLTQSHIAIASYSYKIDKMTYILYIAIYVTQLYILVIMIWQELSQLFSYYVCQQLFSSFKAACGAYVDNPH